MSENSGVGTVIRRRREDIGMSQEDLEEATGFSQSYISQVERGKVRRPSRKRLQIFADALSRPSDQYPIEILLHAADYAVSKAPDGVLFLSLADPGNHFAAFRHDELSEDEKRAMFELAEELLEGDLTPAEVREFLRDRERGRT